MSEIIIPDYDSVIYSGLRLSSPAQVNRSAWTGRRKVVGLPGTEMWLGTFTVDTITTELEEREWRAFLFSLGNQANWFKWMLPCATHIGPKPLVAAGASDGYTLPLDGMQPNARILKAGQFMTVPLPSGHSRAVCLTSDLLADSGGEATAEFRPSLNEAPDENAQVETTKPFIPMSPTDSEIGLDAADGVSGTGFAVEEAI